MFIGSPNVGAPPPTAPDPLGCWASLIGRLCRCSLACWLVAAEVASSQHHLAGQVLISDTSQDFYEQGSECWTGEAADHLAAANNVALTCDQLTPLAELCYNQNTNKQIHIQIQTHIKTKNINNVSPM